VRNNHNIFRLQCEPRSHTSCEDHPVQLINYDDRMRQEEKKYSRLLLELKNSRFYSCDRSCRNNEHSAFSHSDTDKNMSEGESVEQEVTRLTGDEILHGCGLTMEQVLLDRQQSSILCARKSFSNTSTQNAIVFHRTLTLHERNNAYSSSMASLHAAHTNMSADDEKESLLRQSSSRELGKYNLQHWTGVYSFSPQICCKASGYTLIDVHNLHSENTESKRKN
jgi:hypothetical protein